MNRRDFIRLFGRGLAAWPVAARSQQNGRTILIGVLQDLAENELIAQSEVAAFRELLTKLGWTDGSNVRVVIGWAAGNPDRIRELAKELVDLRPDAIVARGTPATVALARATHTIPIVFTVVADPIGAGVAESLAHPGGLCQSNGRSTACGTTRPSLTGIQAASARHSANAEERLCL